MTAPSRDASLDLWLEYIGGHDWQTVDLGLGRLREMLKRMNIERPAPHIITVAGTNGKGTTSIACDALLSAHGYSVGTALSPHIERFNERIRLNGQEANDETIVAALATVEQYRGDLPLTYFEYCVMASFHLFVEHEVDVAVLEIGLGGRLDGFNVVPANCAVITSIGLDHQAFLGDTREQIGREKAGILATGQTVYLGADMPESVLQISRDLDLQPRRYGVELGTLVDGQSWSLQSEELCIDAIPLGPLAPHNLALAILAVNSFAAVNEAVTRRVIGDLKIRGRLEHRHWRGRELYIDVAHNPDGLEFLFQQLAMRQIEPSVLCCAMLQDKDHVGVGQTVTRHSDARWLFTDSHGERALPGKTLQQNMGLPGAVRGAESLSDFLASETKPGDVILGFGSFSMVEQLLFGDARA